MSPYFIEYEWRGNVRELESVVTRLIMFSRGGKVTRNVVKHSLAESLNDRSLETMKSALNYVPEEVLRSALNETNGDVPETANLLHTSPALVRSYLKKYGIDSKLFEKEAPVTEQHTYAKNVNWNYFLKGEVQAHERFLRDMKNASYSDETSTIRRGYSLAKIILSQEIFRKEAYSLTKICKTFCKPDLMTPDTFFRIFNTSGISEELGIARRPKHSRTSIVGQDLQDSLERYIQKIKRKYKNQ
ncbi:hypothetical protein JXA85_04995 [Candidatus Woesearchaeota archaeon]|nr:hypothetical protein [Candidatus Woesearchaeota archaeon]